MVLMQNTPLLHPYVMFAVLRAITVFRSTEDKAIPHDKSKIGALE